MSKEIAFRSSVETDALVHAFASGDIPGSLAVSFRRKGEYMLVHLGPSDVKRLRKYLKQWLREVEGE